MVVSGGRGKTSGARIERDEVENGIDWIWVC